MLLIFGSLGFIRPGIAIESSIFVRGITLVGSLARVELRVALLLSDEGGLYSSYFLSLWSLLDGVSGLRFFTELCNGSPCNELVSFVLQIFLIKLFIKTNQILTLEKYFHEPIMLSNKRICLF